VSLYIVDDDDYSVYIPWVPSAYEVSGEVRSYETGNEGDHAPGDQNNKVYLDNIQYKYSGTWYAPDIEDDMVAEADAWPDHKWDTAGVYDPGFSIWDNRCTA
jgi:hypothetical protein